MPNQTPTPQLRRPPARAAKHVDPALLSEAPSGGRGLAKPKRRKRRANPRKESATEPLDLDQLRPKPYSSTDTAESRSLTVFRQLLNAARVKAELEERDKRPNIDGYLDIVDNDGRSIGQLDVQVKTLSGTNLKARSFQCDLDFLGYCVKGASRQVLLIGVDTAGLRAYWIHLSHEVIASLRKKKSSASVSIKFPKDNTVGADESYIKSWENIVIEHGRRMQQVDPLPARMAEDEKSVQLLLQGYSVAMESYRPEFAPIQDFLDELNRLLDNDFKITKQTLYPNAWKLGIMFSLFSKNELCYSIFPLSKGHNEPLIRKVDASIWKKALEHRIPNSHSISVEGYSGNPILNNYAKEARTRVCELTKEVISARALILNHELLARELVFSLIDRHHAILGLPQRDTYQLDELAFGLYEYLPRWVEYALETLCPDKVIPGHLCGAGQSIDLDALHSFFSDVSKQTPASLQRLIKKRKAPRYKPAIGSARYPLGMFRRHLAFLSEKNLNSIQRPYSKPSNLRGTPGSSRLPSELWLPNDFANNFRTVMNNVLATYNHLLAQNFPLLQTPLSIFHRFDRLVIVLRRGQSSFGAMWSICTYKLACQTHSPQIIDVYCEGIDILPDVTNKTSGDMIDIDGFRYTIVSERIEVCDMNFLLQPLFQQVYSLIERRFQEFTKNWLTENR